jgi:prephenate dehydrogenase
LQAWARREEVREQLRADESAIDLVCGEINEAVSGADLVILAMPTGFMAEVVSSIDDRVLHESSLVTDVGSVKGAVMDEVAPLVVAKGGTFFGSHPMAGSEKKGLDFAEKDLFQGATVILTPYEDAESSTDSESRLTRFWESLGGRVFVRDAETHDRIVAAISHLPHLVAAALARSVLSDSPEAAPFSGGGFRDTTRVAGGPEEMWSGILADNHAAVSQRLGKLIQDLEIWKEALDTLDRDQLRGFLSEARELREAL